MTKLTESTIENFAIELFQRLGYEYIYAPNIAPDSENPVRSSFEEVILTERLQKFIRRINASLPADALDEAIKTVLRIASPDTLANNDELKGMEHKNTVLEMLRKLLSDEIKIRAKRSLIESRSLIARLN